MIAPLKSAKLVGYLFKSETFYMGIRIYKLFYKQPVYKQLALGTQFVKQVLGLNHLQQEAI